MGDVKRQRTSKPATKPGCPNFGSGPCAKHPGYDLATSLKDAPLGRSHRSTIGKQKIAEAISKTKSILKIPDNYVFAMVPGSDTGAMEMAMWSMLGVRRVAVCYWDSFGKTWMNDIVNQLPLTLERGGKGVNIFEGEYGYMPNLTKVSWYHDVVFTLNGTTSGGRVPNFDWIDSDRMGLSICDGTSGVFSMQIEWEKIDVMTFSWQKALGGEAGHGMMVLGPKAVERLEAYTPSWPMPKLFRMTKDKKLDQALFTDSPINTPSMLCVEDYLDALAWVESVGGLDKLIEMSNNNFGVMAKAVEQFEWLHFLCQDETCRSTTSVCFLVVDLNADEIKAMTKLLADEGAAYDINSYKDAPAGLRVWCGATIVQKDLEILVEWLAWAHDQVKSG